MDGIATDVRYALRQLRRRPVFTLVAALSLAIGVGANTAIFSVVNGVILKPLPYPEPERLIYITSQFPTLGFDQFWVSLPEFVDFRDHNQAFSSVGAYNISASNLGTTTPSRRVPRSRCRAGRSASSRPPGSHGGDAPTASGSSSPRASAAAAFLRRSRG